MLWLRSVQQFKLRYTTLLSDGDCKTFNVLQDLKPYGEGVQILKEECVNHVSKRLGTAMRNLVKDQKKGGVVLGGRGKGKLTDRAMKSLQLYYTKAIRSNKTVEAMSQAVWASFYHCSSTDSDPQHDFCPTGDKSWCFYKRAQARGLQPPRHEGNVTTPLCRPVHLKLKPVYERLADPELLRRCLRGKTQNANESLHGVIWRRCPKTDFASKEKVESATLVSVGEFNMGSVGGHCFLSAQGLTIGRNAEKLGKRRDMSRKSQSRRRATNNEAERRQAVTRAQAKERQKNFRAEGGTPYASGAF